MDLPSWKTISQPIEPLLKCQIYSRNMQFSPKNWDGWYHRFFESLILSISWRYQRFLTDRKPLIHCSKMKSGFLKAQLEIMQASLKAVVYLFYTIGSLYFHILGVSYHLREVISGHYLQFDHMHLWERCIKVKTVLFLPWTHPFSSNLLELKSYNFSLSTIRPSGTELGLAIDKEGG